VASLAFGVPDPPGNDGVFHLRFSERLWRNNFSLESDTLPFTILSPKYPDHHWFFHVLLIPFTWLGDDDSAVRSAPVLFSGVFFGAFHRVLVASNVTHPFLWCLVLLSCSADVMGRFSICRPQALADLFLILIAWGLLYRRLRLAFALSALFALTYAGYGFLPVLFLIYLIWGPSAIKSRLYVLTAGLTGAIAGLCLSPTFPDNVLFTLYYVLDKGFETSSPFVPAEWLPFASNVVLKRS